MDAKNVIAAISLSAAVIILYGLFFAPDPQIANQQKLIQEKNITNQTSEAPSIDQPKKVESLSRNDSIAASERSTFENENIKGTISLTGAIIDDLTCFKFRYWPLLTFFPSVPYKSSIFSLILFLLS